MEMVGDDKKIRARCLAGAEELADAQVTPKLFSPGNSGSRAVRESAQPGRAFRKLFVCCGDGAARLLTLFLPAQSMVAVFATTPDVLQLAIACAYEFGPASGQDFQMKFRRLRRKKSRNCASTAIKIARSQIDGANNALSVASARGAAKKQ